MCPQKALYSPNREFLNGHPFIYINCPVHKQIICYDSYRKWTPHYSFISYSHKNNWVIERLKFKESLWEYLSPHTLVQKKKKKWDLGQEKCSCIFKKLHKKETPNTIFHWDVCIYVTEVMLIPDLICKYKSIFK